MVQIFDSKKCSEDRYKRKGHNMKVGHIVTMLKHPDTGEIILTEENIQKFLKHKCIKRYAYILHNADIYTSKECMDEIKNLKNKYSLLSESEKDTLNEDDYIKQNRKKEIGQVKPAHWHIVVEFSRDEKADTIAKWLGIPSNLIAIPKGAGGRNNFLDCVEYLTHRSEKEQQKGKTLYNDEDVISNFDWNAALAEYKSKLAKYGNNREKDYYRNQVLYHGMTLRQLWTENPEAYQNDMEKLNKMRRDYIQNRIPIPPIRINFYIEGKGGIGKGSCAKLLAKALIPQMELEDSVFTVGGTNVTFEGYDGQPIMIWNDRRAINFLMDFGGREKVFDMIDTIPTHSRQNVKNSSVRLVNTFNIINGVEPYEEFLDSLSGEYRDKEGNFHQSEDKGQGYRRFPIILCLREKDFDLLINKGFAEGTFEFTQYIAYKNLVGNFGRIMQTLDGEARDIIGAQICAPIIENTQKLINEKTTKITNVDDIPDEFKAYGKSEVWS